MGEYELLIFLTEDRIYVMEVDLEGQTKRVGFQGEEYFHYESIEDIDVFYNNITETYNVDCLTELDSRIYIIDCGVDKELKWCLLDKFRPIEVLNFIDITNLVPILLSKKGMLKVGEQVVVEFLEKKYAYICDNDYRIGELATRGKKAQQLLKLEEFSFIAVWEGNLAQSDNTEKEILKEKINELQIELNSQKAKYDEKVKELDSLCKSLENIILQKQIQELNIKENEAISQEMISRRRVIRKPVEGLGRFLNVKVENGTNVKANEVVAILTFNRVAHKSSIRSAFDALNDDDIFAPRAGKIVWLALDGDEISGDSEEILGVVGDEADSIEDMLKWGRLKAEKIEK